MKAMEVDVGALRKVMVNLRFVLGMLVGIFFTALVLQVLPNRLAVLNTCSHLYRSPVPKDSDSISDISGLATGYFEPFNLQGRDRPPPPNRNKTILLYGDWTHGQPMFDLPFSLDHCRVPYCEIIVDKDRWEEADAIWWNRHSSREIHPIFGQGPPGRRPEQIYIFATNEGQSFDCSDSTQRERFSDMFNWTMSYHQSSDINWSYGSYVATPWELMKPAAVVDKEIESIWAQKDSGSLVLATSSHCNVPSRRDDYIKELKKYVPVDFYGECGDLGKIPCHSEDECRGLSKKYKFVLAFENVLCKDYVTEKFWKNTMLVGAIPVVRNSIDNEVMKRLAPPGSYINAHDFKGPRELAEHLKLVGDSKSLFSSYFEWKKNYMLVFTGLPNERVWATLELKTSGWCDVCEKLHSPVTEVQRASFEGFCDCIVPNDLEESESQKQ